MLEESRSDAMQNDDIQNMLNASKRYMYLKYSKII